MQITRERRGVCARLIESGERAARRQLGVATPSCFSSRLGQALAALAASSARPAARNATGCQFGSGQIASGTSTSRRPLSLDSTRPRGEIEGLSSVQQLMAEGLLNHGMYLGIGESSKNTSGRSRRSRKRAGGAGGRSPSSADP